MCYAVYLPFVSPCAISPSNSEYTSVNREVYDVQSLDVDSNMYYTILPYKTELDAQMNTVLCHSKQEMKKTKPESLLGNWTSDVCLEMAQEMYKDDIDLSFFQYWRSKKSNT